MCVCVCVCVCVIVCVCVCERERERQTDRQRQREKPACPYSRGVTDIILAVAKMVTLHSCTSVNLQA